MALLDQIHNLTHKRSSSPLNFEETLKSAYSHGLESLYTIEVVDVKSVRRLQEHQPSLKSEKSTAKKNSVEQLELELGNFYKQWMNSFLLSEPIYVLNLSVQAEKGLLKHEKFILKDLIEADLQQFVFLKGLGQGHIDEIKTKLKNYLDERELYKSVSIHFTAWLRSLIATHDRKRAAVALTQYGLEHLYPLSPSEQVEIRNLTDEIKNKWIAEFCADLQSKAKKEIMSSSVNQVVQVFLLPWISRRQGIATYHELMDHLFAISETPKETEAILKLFSEIFSEGRFIFQDYLTPVSGKIYCLDGVTAENFTLVNEKAYSYFYKSNCNYSLDHLTALLEKDFAREWVDLDRQFIEKTLRYSPLFRVRKMEGVLTVKLA